MSRAGRLCVALAGVLALWGCDAGPDAVRSPSAPWPEGSLVAAALPTPQRALVVAADGTIHVGVPETGRFHRARVPAVEGLAALAMADATSGWAVGDGVVLRTTDGGEHWQRQRLPGRAAEHRLVSVAAASPEHAVAIDDRGRLIGTRDGGAVWSVWPIPAENTATPGPAGARQVVCAPGAPLRCLAVGVAGRAGVLELDLRSRTAAPVALAPPAGPQAVAFRAGGSEPDADGVEALVETASRLAGRSVDWRIDVRITEAEIERATLEQDPGVLFDLIEGRGEEILQRLEAAGIATDRISLLAAPPWGFEDRLDDDPDLLDRYWRGRRDEGPSAIVRTRWDLPFEALALDAGRGAAIASAGPGAIFWRPDEEAPLGPVPAPGRARLRAFARTATGWVGAGDQGALWTARVDPARGGAPRAWQAEDVAGSDPFFDTLRSVAVARGGASALVVGDAGRMLWRADEGSGWRALARPASSTKASVPIIR